MRTRLTAIAATAFLALGAAACSPSSSGGDTADEPGGATTVTVRLWDEQVAKAYEESLDRKSVV